MGDLVTFLNQCGSVGIIVRNPEFALNTLAYSELSEPEKILKVFEQGRSIGTHVYADKASFSLIEFREFLVRFGISADIATRIESSFRKEPPGGLGKQEAF